MNREKHDLMCSLILFGVLKALQDNIISNESTEKIVFSPKVLELLSEWNLDKEIIDIVGSGLELADILTLVDEDAYHEELDKLTQKCKELLSTKEENLININRSGAIIEILQAPTK